MSVSTASVKEQTAPAAESAKLRDSHKPAAIRARLRKGPGDQWVGDAVLGGIDGCVTTFAVVAGAIGGGLSSAIVVVMGGAKLLSDAFSMAVSNYESVRADNEHRDAARGEEEKHMREIPDGEREEVRQIFASKGFGGETLDRIVDGITSDGRLWLDTVLSEEFGLRSTDRAPSRAAMTTFAAFVLVGAIPLIPFLVPFFPPEHRFVLSAVVTSLAFLGVGAVKGAILRKKVLRPALSTLVTGGGAAALAFLVALLLRAVYGLG